MFFLVKDMQVANYADDTTPYICGCDKIIGTISQFSI